MDREVYVVEGGCGGILCVKESYELQCLLFFQAYSFSGEVESSCQSCVEC